MRYHAAGAMMRSALALALACSAFACSSRCHAFQSLRSLGVLSAVDAPGSRSRMGGSHSIRRPANAPFPAIGPLRMAAAGKMQLRGGGGAPGCEDTEQQEPLSAVLKEVERAWDAAWGQSSKDDALGAPSASELLALLTRLERAGPAATATEDFKGDEGDGGASRTDAMDILMDAVAGLAMRGRAGVADGERFLDRCLSGDPTEAELVY
ncbi:hypothetical protein T484DRAFT_1865278 [Baffinella frigidus]|nr:hypothetical protein T484DRAFT_1865278 [Cryptophyta sp. CCMP2293]